MSKITSKYLALFLAISILFFYSVEAHKTPSERFIEHTNVEEIAESLNADERPHLPFLIEVAEKESVYGFFGYHGSTQNFRIFQDVIRAVMEEKLGYAIPQDFYFFRTPGISKYSFKNGMKDFHAKISSQNASNIHKVVIQTFLLDPLKSELDIKIRLDDFSKSEKKTLQNIFDDISQQMSEKRVGVERPLDTGSEVGKTASEKIFEMISRILSSKQGKKDFEELQVWLDSKLSLHNISVTYFNISNEKKKNLIANYFYPYWDVSSGQREFLISLNIPLWGNYNWPDEGTLGVVLNNATLEGGDKMTIKFLKEWFGEIGLPRATVDDLVAIARSHIPECSKGVLFQFFDIGSKPYHYADKHNYVSYPYGVPVKDFFPSDVLTEVQEIDYLSGGTTQLQRQLRLLISNQSTLNPYSNLRIVRHDFLGEETAEKINAELKAKLSVIKGNKKKLKAYKAKLKKSWFKKSS